MVYMPDFYQVLVRCGMKPPPYEQWRAHYSHNSDLWPITDRDTQRLIGGLLFKGHLVHIAIEPEWQGRWISKTLLRAEREWTPQADVIAAIPPDNAKAIELVRRLGWKHRGQEEGFEIYAKEKAPCPQP
jgi:GNAT superfamily N-acetyltransferase